VRENAVMRRVRRGVEPFAQENAVMEAFRFDAFVRDLLSRRGMVQAVLGGGAALGMARPAAAGKVICGGNGSTCDPNTPSQCCTGHCKKHKGKYRCAPVGASWGCRRKRDSCSGHTLRACPEQPAGLCVNDDKGKPLCIVAGEGLQTCAICTRDDDCVADFGPTARCIKHCKACEKKAGIASVCVVPVPVV
jgi:hypothetical protein